MNKSRSLQFTLFSLALFTAGGLASAADPDPSAMFSVAVLKGDNNKVKKAFINTLTADSSYTNSDCSRDSVDSDEVDADFPLKKDPKRLYARMFFECKKVTKDTYAAFGTASLAALKAAGNSTGQDPEIIEPIRLTVDTAGKPPGGGGACTLSMCSNGTYRKTTDYKLCTQC